MEIDRQTEAGVATLYLRGRLDSAWSGTLNDALQKAVRDGFHQVRLELSGVVFLSSAGIRVLLAQWKELRRAHGSLAVVAATPDVERTLRLAGLHALLDTPAPPAEPPEVATAAGPRPWSGPGFTGEITRLAPSARWRARFLGPSAKPATPPSLMALGATPMTRVALPMGTLALGLGALGNTDEVGAPRAGELLAVGGAAVFLAPDGANQPDYVITQGQLAPSASLAQGMVAEGEFAQFARFEAAAPARAANLGPLLAGLLDANGAAPLAFAAVVETTALVGACLRRAPGAPGSEQAFAFPTVREWLSFTAEPAHANSVALLVGVTTADPAGPWEGFTRPFNPAGGARAHVHAAVFPYRPVRYGRLDLADAETCLFESGRVLGMLHLLADFRPGVGVGESSFYRGAIWFGPLDL
jgi:anti-anti-sigma factor